MDRVVVVGASLAGLRAAETLRSEGFAGDVVVVGAEQHRPYDRPPLSKKVLAGEWEPDRIHLRQPESFDELDVEWRLGVAATGLDPEDGVLHLSDGTDVSFDWCIIATGAACRRLPEQGRHAHVHELRTLDDAMRLRAELVVGDRHVVVIGAGFIGLEVAATAKQLGNRVTVIEGAPAPLIRGLGAEMGAAIGAMHADRGVDLRCDNLGIDEHAVAIEKEEHLLKFAALGGAIYEGCAFLAICCWRWKGRVCMAAQRAAPVIYVWLTMNPNPGFTLTD